MTKKTIKRKLYVYSSPEVPVGLISAMIECISGFDVNHANGHGRVGVMAISKQVAEDNGYKHIDMLNPEKCISAGVKHFGKLLKQVRMEFPRMPIDDWYLLALACYHEGFNKAALPAKKSRSWSEAKGKMSSGVKFAENIWKEYGKTERRKIT